MLCLEMRTLPCFYLGRPDVQNRGRMYLLNV
nr:MAG TPA: hypothetical protein [Caudoviricetes sp.]DAQ74884.1 MAG TPA: hypothetical protein [Caudoviricetes sp.]